MIGALPGVPPAGRSRALVLAEGGAGAHKSGPDIRAWEIATALAARLEVTVAVHDPAGAPREDLRVVSRRRSTLLAEALRHDAVVAPWVPPYLLTALARRRTMTVADLYDPAEVEARSLTERAGARWADTAQRARQLQLRFADVVLCAGERQRGGILRETELLTPPVATVPPVLVVPLGIGPDPPSTGRRPLRERFPAIGAEDPVILWWGSIWRWMDADTAIHAVELLARRRPEVRLVFSAGRPPQRHLRGFTADEEARSLARSRGVLDRNVFFLDEWVPYDERHEYLLEADIGLNLHRDPAEGGMSARARYMDFLWASLPCVLTEGPELAGRFAEQGFARTVPIADAERTCDALEALIADPAARSDAAVAAGPLAASYRWGVVVEPLLELLEGARERRVPARARRLETLRAATQFYGRRVADKALQRFT